MAHESNLKLIGQVVSQVLEEAAYLVTEESGSELPPWTDHSLLQARLSYTCETSGTLHLVVRPALATEIAANMMGVDLDDAQASAYAEDALGETLNMVGGALLEAWFGDHPELRPEIPQVEVTTAEQVAEQTQNQYRVTLRTDSGDWLVASTSA
jgi:chemotaxis protein CheY-P-specific phosphatase CheC